MEYSNEYESAVFRMMVQARVVQAGAADGKLMAHQHSTLAGQAQEGQEENVQPDDMHGRDIAVDGDDGDVNEEVLNARPATAVAYHASMQRHRCQQTNYRPHAHPEDPSRISRIYEHLGEVGLLKKCAKYTCTGRLATDAELTAVHTAAHVRAIDQTADGRQYRLGNSLYFNDDSAECARIAAATVIDLATEVALGRLSNGFAVVRPPGHHATRAEAMGFCLFNNVACAVRAVQALGLKKVLVFDPDVHHGNGTEDIFEDDPSVLFISSHRGDIYPGTGQVGDQGVGAGKGFTINLPFHSGGLGDDDILYAFDQVVLPAAREFDPDFVFISAGFDACRGDPLGGMEVSPWAFGHMTAALRPLARGKMVLALEGGYSISSICECAEACVTALLGLPLKPDTPPQQAHTTVDATRGSRNPHPRTKAMVEQVMYTLAPYWKSFER